MAPERLLAKSPNFRTKIPQALVDHSQDAEQAALALFSPRGRWGGKWCQFFGVADHASFLLHLRVAALFHDVGKANADFLNMVLAPPSGHIADQLIRHEHISGLVLHHDATRAWLGPAGLDVEVITSAVLCHHLKVTAAPSDRGPSREWGGFETPRRVPLYLNHPDVRAIFHRVATLLGLPPFQGRFPEEIHHAHPVWDVILKRAKRSIIPRFTKGLHGTPRHRLLCALKAGLIASDSSASALAEQGCSIEQWILEASHKPPITPALVDQLILAPRRQAIEQRTGRPFQGHEFQGRLAAQAPPRALLLAGCGSGKTLAAWMWVQAQAARSSFSKAIFLYPTRATSTEGFKDYVWAAGRDGTLLTGTSKYELARLRAELEGAELDSILETPDDQLHYQRRAALDPPLSEADQRMDALPLWKKTFFAATVDQFLSFTENNYGAVILLPALADSVVILDEIHSYDAQMFNALLLLLKNFHLPVLCMTASLSAARREALELAGLVQFPAADDRPYLLDLEAQEQAPRYLVGTTFSMDAMGTALGALRAGKKVIWVVNQVKVCQVLYDDFQIFMGGETARVLCYHSRFKLEDRHTRQAEVVNAFRAPGPVLLITTQVCEMSLDLDADILISEIALPTSLVQRMGRCNRAWDAGRGKPRLAAARCLFYWPETSLPYSKVEVTAGASFLFDPLTLADGTLSPGMRGRVVSQAELTARMVATSNDDCLNSNGAFLGGYYAARAPFRESGPPSFPSILDVDLPAVLAARRARPKLPIDGWVLPVPREGGVKVAELDRADLPKWIQVVSGLSYSVEAGFRG